MCGVAKLLPVQRMRGTPGPCHLDVDAAGEELNRRVGVVVEGQRIGLFVAPDGDHRREAPRIALDRHVVGGGDEHVAVEVRRVRELVEDARELALRRREAHVDDVEALLHGPPKPGEEHAAAAGEPGSEHANAHELAVRRKRTDDPRAGRPVAAEVALEVVRDNGLALAVDRDGNRLLHLADERMAGFDAAVEDADA